MNRLLVIFAAALLICTSCTTIEDVPPASPYASLVGTRGRLTSDLRLWDMSHKETFYQIRPMKLLNAGSNVGGRLVADVPAGTEIYVDRMVRHTVHSTLTTSLLVVLGRVTTDSGKTYSFEYVPDCRTDWYDHIIPWETIGPQP